MVPYLGYLFQTVFFFYSAAMFSNCKLLNLEEDDYLSVETTKSIKSVSFCSFLPNGKESGREISEWWSEKYDDSYGTKIVMTEKMKKKKKKIEAGFFNDIFRCSVNKQGHSQALNPGYGSGADWVLKPAVAKILKRLFCPFLSSFFLWVTGPGWPRTKRPMWRSPKRHNSQSTYGMGGQEMNISVNKQGHKPDFQPRWARNKYFLTSP